MKYGTKMPYSFLVVIIRKIDLLISEIHANVDVKYNTCMYPLELEITSLCSHFTKLLLAKIKGGKLY